jgi:hypothetical protein
MGDGQDAKWTGQLVTSVQHALNPPECYDADSLFPWSRHSHRSVEPSFEGPCMSWPCESVLDLPDVRLGVPTWDSLLGRNPLLTVVMIWRAARNSGWTTIRWSPAVEGPNLGQGGKAG